MNPDTPPELRPLIESFQPLNLAEAVRRAQSMTEFPEVQLLLEAAGKALAGDVDALESLLQKISGN